MRTGYLVVQLPAPGSREGVFGLRGSDLFIHKFGSPSAEVVDEWDNMCWDDEEWCYFIARLDDAQKMATYYRGLFEKIEILAVTEVDSFESSIARAAVGKTIGFDVASLSLYRYLDLLPRTEGSIPEAAMPWMPIWKLEEQYIATTTNEYGLFERYEHAKTVLDCANAMRSMATGCVANMFMKGVYRVLAIGLVV